MTITFLLMFSALLTFTKLHSIIEHTIVQKPTHKIKFEVDTLSLNIFKKIRLLLFVLGAIESTVNTITEANMFVVGIVIMMTGVALRASAVLSLGHLWSYNIVIYENHRIIKRGAYRYIKHPAYIGNIYIPGILLCINSIATASLSLCMIILFYIYRSNIENTILRNLEVVSERIEPLSRDIKQGV